MKKHFIPTCTAIALAVPLGIGASAFTASPAEAFIQAIKHHFNTCSRDVIWQCHKDIHLHVLNPPHALYKFYTSRWLPYGSNGADQAAYNKLEGIFVGYGRNHWYGSQAYDGLEAAFPRGNLVGGRHSSQPFISPADKARIEAENAQRDTEEENRKVYEARVFNLFRNDCANYGGNVVFHPDIGEAGVYRCEGGRGSLTEFTGYDPDNPSVYTTALQIDPVEPLGSLAEIEDIADHRQATSVNRETIVTIVEEFNALEERVLGHNDRISENSFLIDAIGDRLVEVDDRARKNTAGIALGYALGTPGLLPDKRFAFGGGVGNFEGENGIAFTLTGRFTDSVVANVGGGMAGSGDTSVSGFKGTVSFQW